LRERLEGPAPQPPSEPIPAPIPNPRALRLVGREEERDWLCQRLRRGDVAALAGVRGIGGIGKTELAIAVARELENEFAGGAMWFDCGPNDAYAIQERMASALGVNLQQDDLRLRADQLAMAWRSRPPTLVVLDDLRRRHLADFDCIAPPRPPCALLVTSRRSDLPLPGAAVRELDPLTPAQSGDLLASLLSPQMVEAEPEAAAAVAKLLENIPLALVLAARRAERIARRRDESGRRPLAALADELRIRRARVLDQGERPDLSVFIAFDASADDLEPADQARLRRLGVFARNEFDLLAVAAVWEEDKETARRALGRLADAGLVEEVEEATWWMHDLLREYARERLEQDGAEADAARLAHARCWLRYLEETDPRSVEDWRDLAAHRPEVEQAADWLLGDWQREPGLAVGLALQIAWTFPAGMLPRQIDWLRAGLAAAEALLATAASDDDRQAARRRAAQTQSSLADLLRTRGQYDEAERLYRESLRVFEALGDSRSVAVTQSSLADLLRTRGQYDEAERLYRSGLEICRRIREPQGVAVFLMGLGQLALARGRREEALPLLQEARQGFVALGLAHWVADVDDLLAQAQGQMLTLDDLLAMIRAARAGDGRAGEQAWQICDGLAGAPDPAPAALGRALQAVLAGIPPEAALEGLPADLRAHILEVLGG
ncbi:MAG: tetratricopeptide repeat protein, partial [Anaerolineae bacterium]|nr:tetratricopeptide repeat protein [Anaerolineae bacterium]